MKPKNSTKKTNPLWWLLVLLAMPVGFYFVIQTFYLKGRPPMDVYLGLRYEIHGIDISRYQGKIDWKNLTASTINGKQLGFVFIKATEGASWIDPSFEKNIKNARNHGLKTGAYHYFKPKVSPISQAKHFIKTVEIRSGDLPPVLDVEEIDTLSPETLIKNIRIWLKEVEKKEGVKPLIYVNLSYFRKYIEGNFDDYPVWIAHYGTPHPRLAEHHWHFWQHTDRGQMGGIYGEVDMNVFKGSIDDLESLCKK